jgi:predicted PurR-regulated permease PerM
VALDIVRGVMTAVAATVSIFFLTLFMLLEGHKWVESGLDLLPERSRPRWERVAAGVARTIRGYVMGNLVISVVAGVVSWVTLTAAGVPYAVPVSVGVAILDLVPLVGATMGTVLAGLVALTEGSLTALVVVGVFVVYQQVENHLLQPVVYGRAVRLSPLLIAVAILVATAVMGLIGALIAIPVAGSLQIIATELLGRGEAAAALAPEGESPAATGSGAPPAVARRA